MCYNFPYRNWNGSLPASVYAMQVALTKVMPVHEQDLKHEMSADRVVHSSTPAYDADDHLSRLLVAEVEEPWYKSFVNNVRGVFKPEKLPPLELTSKPVAVKDIWSQRENTLTSGFGSAAIHVGVVLLAIWISTRPIVKQVANKAVSLVYTPDIEPYKPDMPKKAAKLGGGGGGGDRSPTPASVGKLPKVAPRQFVPPTAVIRNENPKLVMEPTIVVQPDAPLPNVASPNFGNPLGVNGPPSNGPGSGGGIGSGKGGGVGPGSGNGYGPGSGGNTGGGVYNIGGGVSQPVPIFKPEPEYSEEARKAKFQGVVLLSVVIDETGKTRDIKVLRPLGLGLDEKAIEAVTKWRFRPSMRQGQSVAVRANIEVNFRLL